MFKRQITSSNAVLLLIDHQTGAMRWVESISVKDMKRNVLMLAEAARILNLPAVLTSSMEDQAQGPLLSELESSVLASSMPWRMSASRKRFAQTDERR